MTALVNDSITSDLVIPALKTKLQNFALLTKLRFRAFFIHFVFVVYTVILITKVAVACAYAANHSSREPYPVVLTWRNGQ